MKARKSRAKPKAEKLSCLFAVRTNIADGKIIDKLRGVGTAKEISATEFFMQGRKKDIEAARSAS